MLECFLLLRHAGAMWAPIIAIPGVVASIGAAICLILSGVKGIIVHPRQSQPTINRAASPERVVQWVAKRPVPTGSHR
jgi:hypothetical protein